MARSRGKTIPGSVYKTRNQNVPKVACHAQSAGMCFGYSWVVYVTRLSPCVTDGKSACYLSLKYTLIILPLTKTEAQV